METESKLDFKVAPAGQVSVELLEPLITFLEEYQGAVSYFLGDTIEKHLRNTALQGLEVAAEHFQGAVGRMPDLEKSLGMLAEFLKKYNFVNEVQVEKMGNDTFKFKISGCAFAQHVHGASKPTKGTGPVCPLILMAAKFLWEGNFVGLQLSDSKYSIDGTETEVRAVRRERK